MDDYLITFQFNVCADSMQEAATKGWEDLQGWVGPPVLGVMNMRTGEERDIDLEEQP